MSILRRHDGEISWLRVGWYGFTLTAALLSVYGAYIQLQAGDLSHALTHALVVLWICLAAFESYQSNYWFDELMDMYDRRIQFLRQFQEYDDD